MSAATPPSAPRRPMPPQRPAPAAATARPAVQARATTGWDEDEPEFRLNLSDIPRTRASMNVEGLKPTLLSRFLDLVVPLKA